MSLFHHRVAVTDPTGCYLDENLAESGLGNGLVNDCEVLTWTGDLDGLHITSEVMLMGTRLVQNRLS